MLVGMPMVLVPLPLVGGVDDVAGVSKSASPDRATCERVTPAPQQALELELYVKKEDRRATNDYEDKVISTVGRSLRDRYSARRRYRYIT